MGAHAGACLVLLLIATMALSAMLTGIAIRYARRRQLLDLPGQRRSHDVPTPRGGGVAIVVALLGGALVPAFQSASSEHLLLLMPPIVGIALVGWLDDHGGLSALKRFAMHCAAAAWVFGAPLLLAIGQDDESGAVGLAVITAIVVTLAIVWSINLHNFMDGINGLLTLQAIFVFCVLAGLLAWRGSTGSTQLLVCTAACAGFLPFNFPRARIFMGDVGSGVLGFLVAVAVLWQIGSPRIAAASGLVLCSTFVTDATCTLLSRMLRGRRWYSAHREHLYQWLVRSGFPHAQVVAFYMGWNLLIVLPVVYWMNRMPPTSRSIVDGPESGGLGVAFVVYALAVVVWWRGKCWCLRASQTRGRHAVA